MRERETEKSSFLWSVGKEPRYLMSYIPDRTFSPQFFYLRHPRSNVITGAVMTSHFIMTYVVLVSLFQQLNLFWTCTGWKSRVFWDIQFPENNGRWPNILPIWGSCLWQWPACKLFVTGEIWIAVFLCAYLVVCVWMQSITVHLNKWDSPDR